MAKLSEKELLTTVTCWRQDRQKTMWLFPDHAGFSLLSVIIEKAPVAVYLQFLYFLGKVLKSRRH